MKQMELQKLQHEEYDISKISINQDEVYENRDNSLFDITYAVSQSSNEKQNNEEVKDLQKENDRLRHRIKELEKQIQDLNKQNHYLEQDVDELKI